jgi:hypothetical protein
MFVTTKGEQYIKRVQELPRQVPQWNNDACRSTAIFADSLIDQEHAAVSAGTCDEALHALTR